MVISDNPDVAPQIIRATSRAERNEKCSSEVQRVGRKLKTEISSTEERLPLARGRQGKGALEHKPPAKAPVSKYSNA